MTTLRAAMIVGAGSAAFETIRALVDRLPVMVCPRWVSVKTQPVALDDVVAVLVAVCGREESFGVSYDVGGPEVMTYRAMMERTARLRGRKPLLIEVPLLTPWLSSLWLHLVTPVNAAVTRPLIEGLRIPTLAHDDAIWALAGRERLPFDEAVRRALYSQRLSRKNASSAISEPAMPAKITQNAQTLPKPGKCTFIPKKPVISVSGSSTTEKTVRMRSTSFCRCAITDSFVVLERLDDFLVVVEVVPDALGRVDDVVEVELELLRQETLDVPLEHAQGRALRLDDLPVADDLLLDVRDVADDFFGAALEHVVLERVELVADLVEDREAVVEEVVEHLVEQTARALREELLAERVVLLAAAEEPRDRQQLDRRQRDQVVRRRRRRRARPRSAAGSRGRRRGSGGRRRGTPRRRSRRPSGAGAWTSRPRRRAGASRSARRAPARASATARRDESR